MAPKIKNCRIFIVCHPVFFNMMGFVIPPRPLELHKPEDRGVARIRFPPEFHAKA